MAFFKFILFSWFFIGFLSDATSQQKDINFSALTTKDGLSSNTVNAIIKDKYGLVWFGTDDGLVKFDGINFTTYQQQPGDSTSLQANEILTLHEDKAGNLWIGTSGGSLSLYNRKKNAFFNFPAANGPNSISNNVILSVCSDYLGKIWIGHYTGINILDPVTGRISKFPLTTPSSLSPDLYCKFVFEDSRHLVWIGTDQGLFQYDPGKKHLTHYLHSSLDPASLSGNGVNTVAEDKNGNIWVGTSEGLSKQSPGTNSFINYKRTDGAAGSLSSKVINSVAVDEDELWLGTNQGLDILNTKTGQVRSFSLNYRNTHSLTAKAVRFVYIDHQGIYWLGTIRGGVNKYDKNLNLFNYVQSNIFDEKGLNASIVTSLVEDKNGNVYVGTEGQGLRLFDRGTRLFQHVNFQADKGSIGERLSILTMKMTRNNKLLIGTFSDGLIIFDPSSTKYQQLKAGGKAEDLNANDIYCIYEDPKGNTWLGTNGEGINILNPDHKVILRYTPYPKLSNDIELPINGYIRDIEEDNDGNVWIATHGGGIAVLQPASGKFIIYNTANSNLPNDKVQDLLKDSRGNMWAGTFSGGLSLFNNRAKQFISLSEKNDLQNTKISKIIEDKNGRIWVSTSKGISSIDTATKKIHDYNYHNGVENNFVRGAGLQTLNGELFFGGVGGFNYFNPAYLRKNNNIPSVILTDLKISNRSVAASSDGPIKEHISVAEEIHLDYKQNFALSFVGLNYTSPEQNQYAYKLDGFDQDWNYVGSSTIASYTNLDPGEYIFRVKASNNDGVWSSKDTLIKIYVHPPVWRTLYAYILYIAAFIGLMFYIRYRGIQKLKKNFALEQEKAQVDQERKEAERTRELDRLKIKFLTNLSHEFRTPISLIIGPVDALISQEKNRESSGKLQLVRRNARRLLNLVNQLLDFRKMEEHELKLQESEGELIGFIKEAVDSFTDLSERKNINLIFQTDVNELFTYFDHDKIERILFNLLSNAFKFTLAGGTIRLDIEKKEIGAEESKVWISIKVLDTGIGIPVEQKEKIFERFSQYTTATTILNQGTGIGLSITKEFVKLHGGSISVESEVDKGTGFTILLPFTPLQSLPKSSDLSPQISILEKTEEPLEEAEEVTNLENPTKPSTELPLILLVEDNDDFRFYLKDNLRLYYKVLEATNGKEGWKRTLSHHPQLVVSDISMPYMDGIELTRKIKSDKRTSHVPVILLTALTGREDQLKGLETGANDYITKPFNFEVLNAKIKNLLTLNTQLKSAYSKQIKVIAPEIKIESADEKLLQRVAEYIEKNLTDPQLSVENLSRHVGMSRSSLYTKLLELVGQTPVEYIRSVKLEKAAVLLERSSMNIAQIAYSVGFSSPNYFAKSFKAKYDILPSEYMNKMRKNENPGKESDQSDTDVLF